MVPVSQPMKKGPSLGSENGKRMSGLILFLNIVTFLYLGLVIFGFTPYTNNLDEIKVSVLYFGGPILVCLYLFFAAQGRLRLLSASFMVPVLGYFSILFISTVIAGKPYTWIGWQQLGIHLSLLGGFFCCYGLMQYRKDVKRVIFLYMLFSLGTALFGLFHYSGGFGILYKVLITEQTKFSPISVLFQTFMSAQDDMFGTILNRQFYAAFIVMMLPFSLAYAITEERSHFWRYVAIATIMLLGICLYLAHSKASSGAIVVIAILFYILYKLYAHYKDIRIPHLGIWIAGFVILALTLGYFTADIGPEKFKTVHRSVASRAIIWKGGWDMFLYGPGPDNWYDMDGAPPLSIRSLLIGCGPGSFRILFPRYRHPDYYLHDISNVTLSCHNRYLDLVAETGVLGFVCYMGFLAIFFGMGIKRLRRSPDREMRVYIIAFMCGILGILLTNLFSPNLRWAADATIYWSVLGLGFGAFALAGEDIKEEARGSSRPGGMGAWLRLPSPALAHVLLVSTVLLLPAVFLCVRFGIRYFKAAVNNNTGLSLSKYGETYLEEKDRRLRLIREYPDKASELKNSAAAIEQNGIKFYKQAIQSFIKALEYNPTFITTYYKLAHTFNSIGDVENSLKTYMDLQKYAPDYSEIHFNLGVVYAVQSQEIKSQAIKSQGDTRKELLEKAAQYDQLSLKEFKIAARMCNKAQVQSMYGKKLLATQKYEDARKVYEFLRTLDPEDLEYVRTLAFINDQLEDKEGAVKYYTILYHADPTSDGVATRIEQIYQDLNRGEDFGRFLAESVAVNILDPRPRIRLLELYVKKMDLENARKQLIALTRIPDISTTISLYPRSRQSRLYDLALTARNMEEREAEIYFLKKCLQMDAATSIGRTCSETLKKISG